MSLAGPPSLVSALPGPLPACCWLTATLSTALSSMRLFFFSSLLLLRPRPIAMHFASLLVSWPSRSVAPSPYRSVPPSVRPSPPLARMSEMAAGGNPNLHGERERQGGAAGGQEVRGHRWIPGWPRRRRRCG